MLNEGPSLYVSVHSDPSDPGLSLSPGRSVMAEPDYLEGDCDELIKPKKLINPVKTSRNHQDLHRELVMNQKRSGGTNSSYLSFCLSSLSSFQVIILENSLHASEEDNAALINQTVSLS